MLVERNKTARTDHSVLHNDHVDAEPKLTPALRASSLLFDLVIYAAARWRGVL